MTETDILSRSELNPSTFSIFQSKDSAVKCIADTYKESTHLKLAILNSVKATLNHVVNKKLVDNR